MEHRLAVSYQNLAQQIAAMIPVNWDVVFYLGEVGEAKQSYSSVFYFRESGGTDFIRSHDIPKRYSVPKNAYLAQWMELNRVLADIYDCFESHGQPLWEQFRFSLEQSGKFHADFLYDIMQDGVGTLERELAWAKDTFGFVSN